MTGAETPVVIDRDAKRVRRVMLLMVVGGA
jgi:hypothetical protein